MTQLTGNLINPLMKKDIKAVSKSKIKQVTSVNPSLFRTHDENLALNAAYSVMNVAISSCKNNRRYIFLKC